MDVIYERNKRSDDFLLGVPTTDLTQDDVDALEPGPRAEFLGYIENGGKGWKYVGPEQPQAKPMPTKKGSEPSVEPATSESTSVGRVGE